MMFSYDPALTCRAIKKNVAILFFGVVITAICYFLARLWYGLFPFIEAETGWGDLYNLFVCLGFAGCFFLPFWVVRKIPTLKTFADKKMNPPPVYRR